MSAGEVLAPLRSILIPIIVYVVVWTILMRSGIRFRSQITSYLITISYFLVAFAIGGYLEGADTQTIISMLLIGGVITLFNLIPTILRSRGWQGFGFNFKRS